MIGVSEGRPDPLGAVWDGRGVNFALFSANATAVDLCLFDPAGRRETHRLPLPARTEHVWHGHFEGVRPGQLYGYRVYGPYDPKAGHRFNPNKLLIDPYARQLRGRIRWHDALYGYRVGARGDLVADRRDSAPMMPKCVVEEPAAAWGDDRPPRRPWSETVIYEAHVKGLTQLHPDIPAGVRGTYAALGHPAVIEHLVKLGITAVELLPIHAFADDRFLVEKGLRNYWGYSTLAFFAPEPRYFGDAGPHGLKGAIRALHDAGIEVILDVVYNHTAEGNEIGPTLSLRGIDNASYYKHQPDNPHLAWDVTGTGNTLNLSHPRVLQMVMDSLRHWVETYHVDGFRFDLATALARDPLGFTERAGFLRAIVQDPVLSRVKLIAEPWDLGEGGYRLGGFPPGFCEWNDQFRDSVRGFWRGDAEHVPKLARAVTGFQDVFQPSGRHPWASVNYVTAHDGFTLADLVAYNERHNLANGEDNRDGHGHNLSWNFGVEGPSEDPEIRALRARQKRNLLATLFLSQGTPMMLMGDEMSRSQGGNNNAYCQDNAVSWLDWTTGQAQDPGLAAFCRRLIALRRDHAAFRRRSFHSGDLDGRIGLRDVHWLAPEGREMTNRDWGAESRRTLGMQFGNDAADGRRLLLVFNADRHDVPFRLPDDLQGRWRPLLDTRTPEGEPLDPDFVIGPGGSFLMSARSLLLLGEDRPA